jgi:methionine sulfoxide reductase catalytic subunit
MKNGYSNINPAEVTPKELYLNRRQFMKAGTAAAILGGASVDLGLLPQPAKAAPKLTYATNRKFASSESLTDFDDATNYCNFYEFTTDKNTVARKSKTFQTKPWSIRVEGLVKEEKYFMMEDLLKLFPLEERIYRLRCVEAWSMVIPWIGFPLADFLTLCQPSPEAKFVEFTTLLDPKQMPGQNSGILEWPYTEALRMDEAMHPLTLLAVGMYGEPLPNQNGAPIRLVVPWKYGFKYIKSIVKVRFTKKMVRTSWMRSNAMEYGFYANVNPAVDHPRWTQKRERRIGEWKKRKTTLFNGYGEQVAHLYKDMDLIKNF